MAEVLKILTVANLVERKRIDLCALTCAALDDDYQVDWTVVGNGPLEADIRRLAPGSFHLKDRVEDLKEFYNNSDIFVLPSSDEGFGMVYAEAIMCGCPVICRKNDGGEEIVEKTKGGLAVDIPESDEAAVVNIRQAVEKIIENKDRYMSADIVEKARQLVDPTAIKNKWETLLKKYGDKLN